MNSTIIGAVRALCENAPKDTIPLACNHMSFRAHVKQKVWIATYAQQIFQWMGEVSSRDLLEQVAKRRRHLFESNNGAAVHCLWCGVDGRGKQGGP